MYSFKYVKIEDGMNFKWPSSEKIRFAIRGTIRMLDCEPHISSYMECDGDDGYIIKMNYKDDTIPSDCIYVYHINDKEHWYWMNSEVYRKYKLSKELDNILEGSIIDEYINNDVDKLTKRGIL